MTVLWHELLPSAQQVRDHRDATGEGLYTCKKQLLRAKIEDTLYNTVPETETEKVLVACLLALLHEGII